MGCDTALGDIGLQRQHSHLWSEDGRKSHRYPLRGRRLAVRVVLHGAKHTAARAGRRRTISFWGLLLTS